MLRMRTVYKYEIPITDWTEIQATRHAKVLSAGMQNDHLYAWVLVDTEHEPQKFRFRVAGTGHDLDTLDHVNAPDFVGTVFLETLVFHIFAWEVP